MEITGRGRRVQAEDYDWDIQSRVDEKWTERKRVDGDRKT